MSQSPRRGPPGGRPETGARDASPFRPGAPVSQAATPHEVESTVPGLPPSVAVDQAKTLEVSAAELAAMAGGGAPRSTQPFTREAKRPADEAPAPRPAAEPSPGALTQLGGQIEELRRIVEATARERQELLDEARAVNRNFQKLLDKAIAERDGLAKELGDTRGQYANDVRKQAQAFTELQRDLERERREMERKLRDAEERAQKAEEKAGELEKRLAGALASRDRVAARVQQVENNLEATILPLREELEQARAAEARARIELDGARREIGALKLLAGPPPR